MPLSNPKISIIIPVYNAEQYIERCLNSIIQQEVTDWEVIVIDDGSEDKSGLIIDKIVKQDNRIKVWHISNGGVSNARNKGLKKATGEWITFIDADDWIDSDYFNCLINNNDEDIVMLGFKKIEAPNRIIQVWSPSIIKSNHLDTLSSYNTNCWGYFYRNSIIKKYDIRFPSEVKYGEDQVFLMKYLISSETILINSQSGYNYFQHDMSAMAQPFSDKRAKDHLTALLNLLHFKKKNKFNKRNRKIESKMFRKFEWAYWYIGLRCNNKLKNIKNNFSYFENFLFEAKKICPSYTKSFFSTKFIIYIYFFYLWITKR